MFPCWIDFEKLIHKDIIEMFSPDVFRGILRNSQSGLRCVMPMIHVYGFSKAEDPEHDFNEVSITAATFFFYYVQIPFFCWILSTTSLGLSVPTPKIAEDKCSIGG